MNTKTIEMPDVMRCEVAECAYNAESACRARAITIGDQTFPGCDTFLNSTGEHSSASRVAGVGACKVAGCKHNRGLDCQADEIIVALSGAEPACQTFVA